MASGVSHCIHGGRVHYTYIVCSGQRATCGPWSAPSVLLRAKVEFFLFSTTRIVPVIYRVLAVVELLGGRGQVLASRLS